MMPLFDFLNVVTTFVNRLLALAIAFGVLALYFTTLLDDFVIYDWLRTYRPTIRWVAFGVVVANIIPLLEVSVRSRGKSGYLSSPGGSGPNRVRVRAIRRSLQVTASTVPGVVRAKLSVQRLSPRRYRVSVRYSIIEGDNAIAVGERLQLVLERRLSELVVLDKRHKIDIEVALAGVVRQDKASPAPEQKPEGFKGPVYAVGSEPDSIG